MNFSPVFPPPVSKPTNINQPMIQEADPASHRGFSADREWHPVTSLMNLFRAWRLICGAVLIALIATWTALSFWPKLYTAETLLLLDPRNQPNLQLDEVMAGIAPDDQTISSEVLILQSASLAAKVIAELGLAKDPQHNRTLQAGPGLLAAVLPDGVRQRLFRSFGAVTGPALSPEARLEMAEVRVLQSFYDRLEVARVGRSHAIRVAYTAG